MVNQKMFNDMFNMSVSDIFNSTKISMEDKDDFFEEVKLMLMEEFDKLQDAEQYSRMEEGDYDEYEDDNY